MCGVIFFVYDFVIIRVFTLTPFCHHLALWFYSIFDGSFSLVAFFWHSQSFLGQKCCGNEFYLLSLPLNGSFLVYWQFMGRKEEYSKIWTFFCYLLFMFIFRAFSIFPFILNHQEFFFRHSKFFHGNETKGPKVFSRKWHFKTLN